MKRGAWFVLLLVVIMGCVTLEMPKYLEEEFQYRKNFDANFNATFAASVNALESLGWKVAETESLPVFKSGAIDESSQEYTALIFTEIKQRSLFIFSTYLTLNVYVRSIDENSSEVEIRYLSITAFPPFFKEKRIDRNDGLVNKIYRKIDKYLITESSDL